MIDQDKIAQIGRTVHSYLEPLTRIAKDFEIHKAEVLHAVIFHLSI